MPWTTRLFRALRAARAAYKEADALPDPAPSAVIPPSYRAEGRPAVPAAFKRKDEPVQPSREALRFYTARDLSNDPRSPYRFLNAKSAQHLNLYHCHNAKFACPTLVDLHWQYVLANSDEGRYVRGTHNGEKIYAEYKQEEFGYEVYWVHNQAILVANHFPTWTRTTNGVATRERTYITRLGLPHLLFKLTHTVVLPAALASALDIWEEVEG